MIEFLLTWYRRYLSDPQAVLLAVFLSLSFAVIFFMGRTLAPLLAAIVFGYLLEGLVRQMERIRVPRLLAVAFVFALFLAAVVFLVLGLIPILYHQVIDFLQGLPRLVNDGQQILLRMPDLFPGFVSTHDVEELTAVIRRGIADFGQNVLSLSLASIPTIMTALAYVFLGSLLVFFFLKDKRLIMAWVRSFLPRDRDILVRVWREMDDQIGNYVRGKFIEILIVGSATYVLFAFLGLAYAALLAVLVGISVIIPFVGAVVVTVPVAFAGYGQWGWSSDFAWFLGGYALIHALDANLLVPLLLSEAVNLHPAAIIVAVLIFGELWGFWGVFFAIPLATLVKALLSVWPRPVIRAASEAAG
jgi:putative permease